MPLKIKKVKSGFKVCDDKGKCLSNKPLTLKRAKKQELAVRLQTLRKEGRIPARGKGAVLNRVGSDIANVGKAGVKSLGSALASVAADGVNSLIDKFVKKLKEPIDPKAQAAAIEAIKKAKGTSLQSGKGASSFAVLSKTKVKF